MISKFLRVKLGLTGCRMAPIEGLMVLFSFTCRNNRPLLIYKQKSVVLLNCLTMVIWFPRGPHVTRV